MEMNLGSVSQLINTEHFEEQLTLFQGLTTAFKKWGTTLPLPNLPCDSITE